MDEKSYFITLRTGLNTGEIREMENDAHFDYEIKASSEQAHQLHDLIEKGADADFNSYVHSHVPFNNETEFNTEKDITMYDETLRRIYQTIYDLGTPETKKKMEQQGVLEAFGNR